MWIVHMMDTHPPYINSRMSYNDYQNIDEQYRLSKLELVDAAKGQYVNFLPDTLRLLSPGGLLVSDNVLQDGDVMESRFAVTRRNRTIHSRMREYLYEVTHHEALETIVLPVGDGVTVSVKLDACKKNF